MLLILITQKTKNKSAIDINIRIKEKIYGRKTKFRHRRIQNK